MFIIREQSLCYIKIEKKEDKTKYFQLEKTKYSQHMPELSYALIQASENIKIVAYHFDHQTTNY